MADFLFLTKKILSIPKVKTNKAALAERNETKSTITSSIETAQKTLKKIKEDNYD